MRLQSCKSSNFGNFGSPNLRARDKMTFGVGLVAKHKEYYKGEGGGFCEATFVPLLPVLQGDYA
jgi:hypothetical protein